MRRRGLRSIALTALALPATAASQDTTRPTEPAATGLVRAPLMVDGGRVTAGTRTYQVVVTNDSGARVVGTHTIAVSESGFGGQQAWQVTEHRQSQPPFPLMTAVDTAVLSRGSLSPLRWDAMAGGGRFVAAIANDTMYGGTTGPGVRKTFIMPLAPLTITSEGALDLVLQGATLGAGWVADAIFVVVDLGGPKLGGLRLQVEREERIVVPAGTYDVWTVSARTGTSEKWLWVDKRTGIVVKTAQSPAHLGGMIFERTLVGG